MPHESLHELRQFHGAGLDRALRNGLAFLCRVEDVRRQRRDLRGCCRCSPANQIIERLQPERDEQSLQHGGRFLQAILRARRGRQGTASQPIATTFIAQLPAVTAGAMQLPVGRSRVRDGPGSRIH